MKKFKNHTLSEFLDILSQRKPVPGGGSAAALTAATGAALISMAADYSLGKGRLKSVENRIRALRQKSEKIRRRLLMLVDLDAEGYLKVVKVQGGSATAKRNAMRQAAKAPREVCQLCYRAVELTPYLVENGNPHLISDIMVAAELLLAAFNAAHINVEINT